MNGLVGLYKLHDDCGHGDNTSFSASVPRQTYCEASRQWKENSKLSPRKNT